MSKFFPPIEPFNEFYIEVSAKHKIYVEESGNPNGKPVIFYMEALEVALSLYIDSILIPKYGV